jgi:biotin synthase-related radical SAM superfamily protein
MMDEYNKLHEQFIDLVAEYHNAHLLVIVRKSSNSMTPLKKIVRDLEKTITKMKRNNVKLAKHIAEQKNLHWIKTNAKRKRVKND